MADKNEAPAPGKTFCVKQLRGRKEGIASPEMRNSFIPSLQSQSQITSRVSEFHIYSLKSQKHLKLYLFFWKNGNKNLPGSLESLKSLIE